MPLIGSRRVYPGTAGSLPHHRAEGVSTKRRCVAVAPSPSGANKQPCMPMRRVLTKPDGRCQVRAVLHAARVALPQGVDDILSDDSSTARTFIRAIRTRAAQRLVEAKDADSTLAEVVEASFPDERYASLSDWVAAMDSDDTSKAISTLWQGGGHWLLHGLGMLFNVSIYVTSWHPLLQGSGFSKSLPQLVVLAKAEDAARVDLAMMHDDDGVPNHFDVLESPHEGICELSSTMPTAGHEKGNQIEQRRRSELPVERSLPPSPPSSECAAPTYLPHRIDAASSRRRSGMLQHLHQFMRQTFARTVLPVGVGSCR